MTTKHRLKIKTKGLLIEASGGLAIGAVICIMIAISHL